MNAALMAKTADLEIMVRELALIFAPRAGIPLMLDLILRFAIDQGDIAAREPRIDFRASPTTRRADGRRRTPRPSQRGQAP